MNLWTPIQLFYRGTGILLSPGFLILQIWRKKHVAALLYFFHSAAYFVSWWTKQFNKLSHCYIYHNSLVNLNKWIHFFQALYHQCFSRLIVQSSKGATGGCVQNTLMGMILSVIRYNATQPIYLLIQHSVIRGV